MRAEEEQNGLEIGGTCLLVPETSSDLLTVGFDDLEVLHDGSSVSTPHFALEVALAQETKSTRELVSHDRVRLQNFVLSNLRKQF